MVIKLIQVAILGIAFAGADLRGGAGGAHPPPLPEMTCGFLTQLVFCKKILCGLLVLKYSKRRVHPLLKKILDKPLVRIINSHGQHERYFLILAIQVANTWHS